MTQATSWLDHSRSHVAKIGGKILELTSMDFCKRLTGQAESSVNSRIIESFFQCHCKFLSVSDQGSRPYCIRFRSDSTNISCHFNGLSFHLKTRLTWHTDCFIPKQPLWRFTIRFNGGNIMFKKVLTAVVLAITLTMATSPLWAMNSGTHDQTIAEQRGHGGGHGGGHNGGHH
jgi:hypothetical protein